MKQSQVQQLALALPETTEEPHHHRTSFRVRGKIFATAVLSENLLNIMVGDSAREPALDIYSNCVEPLYWGKKVLGIRVNLLEATPDIVAELLKQAWSEKAPRALVAKS
jgi:hypothetical protein